MSDLFSAAADARLRSQAPLAARMRPRTIDDVVGQRQLLGPGRPLRAWVKARLIASGTYSASVTCSAHFVMWP